MNNNPEWFVEGLNPQEFWTEERCYISELLNDPASPEVSVALARVEPGVTTQLHALDGIIERYILRKGQGNVEINGIQHPVKIHDQIIVPTNASQQIPILEMRILNFIVSAHHVSNPTTIST